MSMAYGMAYRQSVTPWETAAGGGQDQLDQLFDQAMDDAGEPGRALDLGCGRGVHAVSLAQRGWQVTGVDQFGRTVELARTTAAAAGVQAAFVQADVTALPRSIGSGFNLVLNIGCFQDLMDDQRMTYGREVDRVTAPGAKLLILAFRSGGGPLPKGADAEDIRSVLPEWELTGDSAADTSCLPKLVQARAPHFYWFAKP